MNTIGAEAGLPTVFVCCDHSQRPWEGVSHDSQRECNDAHTIGDAIDYPLSPAHTHVYAPDGGDDMGSGITFTHAHPIVGITDQTSHFVHFHVHPHAVSPLVSGTYGWTSDRTRPNDDALSAGPAGMSDRDNLDRIEFAADALRRHQGIFTNSCDYRGSAIAVLEAAAEWDEDNADRTAHVAGTLSCAEVDEVNV